jgi:hypothetical protein
MVVGALSLVHRLMATTQLFGLVKHFKTLTMYAVSIVYLKFYSSSPSKYTVHVEGPTYHQGHLPIFSTPLAPSSPWAAASCSDGQNVHSPPW